MFNRNEAKKCLELLLASQQHRFKPARLTNYTFIHSVITSFVDFSLNEVRISDEMKSRVASFCASITPKDLISILCSCCQHKVSSLFSLLKEALAKWNMEQKRKYFTTGNCFELLSVCITRSTSQMFHSCIQLLTEVLKLEVERFAIYYSYNTLLHIAAEAANYEALEYLLNRVSFQLLDKCFGGLCLS